MGRRWRAAAVGALVVAAAWGAARGQDADLLDVPTVSNAVYGLGVYPIESAHGLHAAQIACATCHPAGATSTTSADDLLPRMEQCGECHSEVADTQDPEACGLCHPGYRPVWADGEGYLAVRHPRFPLVGPEPVVRLRPNLHFSHAQHVEAACEVCHSGEGGATLPAMALCVDCHESAGVTHACASCHPTGPNGRLVTILPATLRTPEVRLVPADHRRDWEVGHGVAAGLAMGECMTCHAEDDCLRCHDGSLGVDSIHPPGFVGHHAAVARRDEPACAGCHTATSFCFDCHADAGLLTDDDHRPPPGTIVHPLGWLGPGGGLHVREAEMDLMACASCHAESDCAACHTTVNPHGTEFFERCGALLEANPAVCARCHADVSGLMSGCR